MEHAAEFLLIVHLIVPTPTNTIWYTEFQDYMFSRILTLHILPKLVCVSISQESDSDSSHEWMGDNDDKDDDLEFLMDEDEDEEDN